MGLITKSQPPLVGVDISSTAVKLLQLSRAGNRYRVEHYAVEPLPPNAVVEKNIVEVEAVGEAIRRAMARSGSKARHAAAAVAGSAVITKLIPMPSDLDDEEMESQVELEAVNYIPYPIEEVNLDFEVLGPMPGNTEMVQVLLAASRSENVETRASALELGGLTARVMDVEAFAIENAFALLADTLSVRGKAKAAVGALGWPRDSVLSRGVRNRGGLRNLAIRGVSRTRGSCHGVKSPLFNATGHEARVSARDMGRKTWD